MNASSPSLSGITKNVKQTLMTDYILQKENRFVLLYPLPKSFGVYIFLLKTRAFSQHEISNEIFIILVKDFPRILYRGKTAATRINSFYTGFICCRNSYSSFAEYSICYLCTYNIQLQLFLIPYFKRNKLNMESLTYTITRSNTTVRCFLNET